VQPKPRTTHTSAIAGTSELQEHRLAVIQRRLETQQEIEDREILDRFKETVESYQRRAAQRSNTPLSGNENIERTSFTPLPFLLSPLEEIELNSEMSTRESTADQGTSSNLRAQTEQTDKEGRPVKESWMELSPEAREVLKGDKHKLRLQVFNKDRPENFETWLTSLEDYFRWTNIDNDEAKINIAMTQMDLTTRELLEDALTTAKGYDWKAFKEELLQQFPEAENRKIGSRDRLVAICQKAAYIPFGHTSKLAAFNREFNLEAKKLKNLDTPLITNVELVRLYLETLEPFFKAEIKKFLLAKAMNELTKKKNDIRDRLQKSQDPWTIEDVQETAITMSVTMGDNVLTPEIGRSGRDTYVGLMADGSTDRLFGAIQGRDQHIRPSMPETKEKKEKDEWEQKVSVSMDTYNVKLKELGYQVSEQSKATESTNRMLFEVMKLMKVSNNMNGSGNSNGGFQRPCERNRNGNDSSSSKPNWLEDILCWFCSHKGHTANDCPEQLRFLELGILRRNGDGKIELKDGSRLPYVKFGEGGPSRAERVLSTAKEKGWIGKGTTSAQGMLFEIEEEPISVNNFQSALEDTLKDLEDGDESRALSVLMKKLNGSKN